MGGKEWRSPNRQEPMGGRWGSAFAHLIDLPLARRNGVRRSLGARNGDLRIAKPMRGRWGSAFAHLIDLPLARRIGVRRSLGQGMAISESPRVNEGPMGKRICSPHRLTIGSADRSPPLLGARSGDLRIAKSQWGADGEVLLLTSSTYHWLGGSESAAPWGPRQPPR